MKGVSFLVPGFREWTVSSTLSAEDVRERLAADVGLRWSGGGDGVGIEQENYPWKRTSEAQVRVRVEPARLHTLVHIRTRPSIGSWLVVFGWAAFALWWVGAVAIVIVGLALLLVDVSMAGVGDKFRRRVEDCLSESAGPDQG